MFARALVHRDTALERFTRRGGLSFLRRRPQPQMLELVYFPYHLLEISLAVGGDRREIPIACDGVIGNLAFLETEALELLDETQAPCFDFRIGAQEAIERVQDEYRWILVEQGFHRKNPPRMKAVTELERFYYPYWVAYYRTRKGFDFKVLDAISRAPLGIRMRRAFLAAFSQQSLSPGIPGRSQSEVRIAD